MSQTEVNRTKGVRMQPMFSPELYKKILRYSKKTGIGENEIIRIATAEYLESKKNTFLDFDSFDL